MIRIEISGKKEPVEKAVKQVSTLMLTSGKVVRQYDRANEPERSQIKDCDVVIIKTVEGA